MSTIMTTATRSPGSASPRAELELTIKPHDTLAINFRELWQYRELFFFLAWRDVKVRYQQTAMGATWAIAQPLVMMLVFTGLLNKMAGVKTGAVPYALFAYTGLLFWQFFSAAVTAASNSLVASQGIVTKIYFPRLIVPGAAVAASLVDFACAASILVVLFFVFGFTPGLQGILLFLPALAVTVLAATGLGLLLASVNVRFRDVRHALPFFLQVLFFATPVVYPLGLLPTSLQWLVWVNPVTGAIVTIRAALLGDGTVSWGPATISLIVAVALFVAGLVYFKRKERHFADVI